MSHPVCEFLNRRDSISVLQAKLVRNLNTLRGLEGSSRQGIAVLEEVLSWGIENYLTVRHDKDSV